MVGHINTYNNVYNVNNVYNSSFPDVLRRSSSTEIHERNLKNGRLETFKINNSTAF